LILMIQGSGATRGYIGFNTNEPDFRLDMVGDSSRLYLNDTSDVKSFGISGTTDVLSEFSTVVNMPTLGGAGGIAIGTIGMDAVVSGIVPERGQTGDTYIYSSARANGLNIISKENPSGTADYIRFYAGQDATGTPDIHIQGNGATKGYVALGHDTPTEVLDVIGSIKMVDGNETNGYIMTSDANGVGTWQAAISGDTTYWTAGTGTDSAVLIGGGNIASGITSVAEGTNTVAGGDYSHAEGRDTVASGDYSHAEGEGTVASGFTSHAEGSFTVAGGSYSHAEGRNTVASGDYSHAEGNGTVASGNYSHAEGDGTVASLYSHAEGRFTVASGFTSHAEGNFTVAGGSYSHAEGQNTVASGDWSHAEGIGTVAGDTASHAGGVISIASGYTSFIHSQNSLVTGDRSVVLGGSFITGSTNDMVYVPDLNIVNCPSYDDDTAAGVGGLLVGEVFQTTGAGGAPLNVAGILMIKQ
jgi:hypothetical protein